MKQALKAVCFLIAWSLRTVAAPIIGLASFAEQIGAECEPKWRPLFRIYTWQKEWGEYRWP